MNHEHFLLQTINLAKQGWPMVAPNPMVGCVIVKDDEIVAQGFHAKYGEGHAEVNAIKNLPGNINPADCTLYVNLEPCSHHGKTPPCADLIINSGFKKVVISNLDPNPIVAGKGIEKLKAAGIKVEIGILENEGNTLNKRFFTFHQKKRPYTILKWAQTADGFISKLPVPENRKENIISTLQQQTEVHQMRANEMAIMVGKNTVLADNPFLTTRLVQGKNPIRIVIDKKLEIPANFNVFNKEAQAIIFNSLKDEIKINLSYVKIDFTKNVLEQINHILYILKIQSVLVEGGAFLLNDFIQQKLYDEVKVFINKDLIFEKGVKAPSYS